MTEVTFVELGEVPSSILCPVAPSPNVPPRSEMVQILGIEAS